MKTFTELKKFVMDLDDDVRDMYSIDQEIVEIMDKENLDEVTAISKFIQRARRAGRKLRAKSAMFVKKRMRSLKRYKKPEAIKRIARNKAIDLLVQKIYKLPYRSLPMQRKAQITQNFLSKALMIAVALITLILVSQFNSAIKPFIIIITVLFSTIGVFFGLALFNMDFVIIMTGIGIVSLAGIVVNNAIVLIDYIDLVKSRKRRELKMNENAILSSDIAMECIQEGGQKRLKPVLLTAITTVLGLLPLATGMNINFYTLLTEFDAQIFFGGDNAIFWGPMAWTVIFGLSFATFLTLILVPVMYLLSDKIRNKITAVIS